MTLTGSQTWISDMPERCLNPQCNAPSEKVVVKKEIVVDGIVVGEAVCVGCGETSLYTLRHEPRRLDFDRT